jgi:hypothetical protein
MPHPPILNQIAEYFESASPMTIKELEWKVTLSRYDFPWQEIEPSIPFPIRVPPVFPNHTGRIAIGTPEVTKAILAKSVAVQKLVANSNYLPDNTIAWLVHSDNINGHSNQFAKLPDLTDPEHPEEFVQHDMLSYIKLSYPQQYASYINHDHLPKLQPQTLDVKIPTNGDLKGWLNTIHNHFLPYFSEILKSLIQADPLNHTNTQTKFSEIKREYLKNPAASSPEKFLLKELSVYNYSSTILAKVILASIECERDLFAPVAQTLLQNPGVKTDGRTLFYLVKENLMANAGSLTEEIKDYIRDLKMSVKGYPLWKE